MEAITEKPKEEITLCANLSTAGNQPYQEFVGGPAILTTKCAGWGGRVTLEMAQGAGSVILDTLNGPGEKKYPTLKPGLYRVDVRQGSCANLNMTLRVDKDAKKRQSDNPAYVSGAVKQSYHRGEYVFVTTKEHPLTADMHLEIFHKGLWEVVEINNQGPGGRTSLKCHGFTICEEFKEARILRREKVQQYVEEF